MSDPFVWKPGQPNPKPLRGTVKRARRGRLRENRTAEQDNKRDAKKRDGFKCRFPLCECRKHGYILESAHNDHKGPGGDPLGIRSETGNLITLCTFRHQASRISLHRHGLRPKFLTKKGYDGPIAWEVDVAELFGGVERWREIARESKVGTWLPFTAWQQMALHELARMEG